MAVSTLGGDDGHLHYEDGSHRWQDPHDPDGDESWRAMVEAHVAEHRAAAQGQHPTGWPGRLHSRGQGEPHA